MGIGDKKIRLRLDGKGVLVKGRSFRCLRLDNFPPVLVTEPVCIEDGVLVSVGNMPGNWAHSVIYVFHLLGKGCGGDLRFDGVEFFVRKWAYCSLDDYARWDFDDVLKEKIRQMIKNNRNNKLYLRKKRGLWNIFALARDEFECFDAAKRDIKKRDIKFLARMGRKMQAEQGRGDKA